MESANQIDGKSELLRQLIHLSSAAFPVFYLFTSRNLNIVILSVALTILVAIDVLRYYSKNFRNFYFRMLRHILRTFEQNDHQVIFTGATYLMFSFLMMVVIFPKPIAISSLFVLVFCDSIAALIGRNFGQSKIGSKTIEGSIAFFFTGIIVILLAPKLTAQFMEYFSAVSALLITTIVELLPLKLDDNITIPFTFAIIYYLTFKIFTG